MLDLTEYEQFAQLAQELEPQDEVYSGFDKFNQLDAPDMDIPLMEHLEFFEDPSSDDGEYNNAAFEWLTSKCVEVHRKNGRSDTPSSSRQPSWICYKVTGALMNYRCNCWKRLAMTMSTL